MLKGEQIAEADLTDWRKLAQGLHARYLVDDFGSAARFVAAGHWLLFPAPRRLPWT